MIIQCSSCGTKFKFDDSKITAAGVKLKCSKCKSIFVVKKPQTPVAPTPPKSAPVAKAPAGKSCPYCKKAVPVDTHFCPHCGEDVTRKSTPAPAADVLCPKCKKPNISQSKFCAYCGQNMSETQKEEPELPQEVTCTECGTKNTGEGKFCSTCGGKLPLPTANPPKLSAEMRKMYEEQGLGESKDEAGGTIFPFTAGWGDEYSGDTIKRKGEDTKLIMTLRVIAGPDEGKEFTITKKNTVIGREDSDINIDDFKTSRHHAEIEILGNKFLLKDLDSTNGTFLNDNLTPADFLSHDDEIKIGDTIYQVVIEEERFV